MWVVANCDLVVDLRFCLINGGFGEDFVAIVVVACQYLLLFIAPVVG
jgi:hypothetical protein